MNSHGGEPTLSEQWTGRQGDSLRGWRHCMHKSHSLAHRVSPSLSFYPSSPSIPPPVPRTPCLLSPTLLFLGAPPTDRPLRRAYGALWSRAALLTFTLCNPPLPLSSNRCPVMEPTWTSDYRESPSPLTYSLYSFPSSPLSSFSPLPPSTPPWLSSYSSSSPPSPQPFPLSADPPSVVEKCSRWARRAPRPRAERVRRVVCGVRSR